MSAMGGMVGVGRLRAAPSRVSQLTRSATRASAARAQQALARLSPLGTLWLSVVWPVLQPLGQRIRRVLLVMTGFGWTVLGASVLAWFVGARWGWQEFTAFALVAFVLLLLAVPFVLGRSAYAIALGLASTHVVVGQRAVGSVTVTNPSARPMLPARIELPVGAGLAAFQLPRLAPGAEHEDLFTIPTQRRTVLSVGPVRSVRGDALGLFRRVIGWTDATDLFVHPRTVHLDGSSSGFLRDLEGLPTSDLSNDDVSFHALREYVPGDDLRNVHWRSSARTGTIMVRQFEETRRSHLAIALSRNPLDYATATDAAAGVSPGGDGTGGVGIGAAGKSIEEFELAVSICGSLGLQALTEEKQLTVLAQEQIVPTQTGKRLLDGLSAVETGGSRADIVQLARQTGVRVPNASVVVLLFGSTVPPARIRSAASHLPSGVRVIAVRCEIGAPLSRRSIAETPVLTVGALDDLPFGMRRVSE
ncbi:DUF58 domain-containing protein [Cryobacterium frigoriphilum]|uniref:DUF58 domain-containing protein n=1 Tax=Cryobacterium frigoriphilum TaxID=1259150 RepID=A0A4V3IQH7_9MICO|nr:DUF58 domain-containing protein [Cryobacterium frigoriphilum]TFD46340.1 DUF58 domain-containing protein [Cryobacterium frigoriphilum]